MRARPMRARPMRAGQRSAATRGLAVRRFLSAGCRYFTIEPLRVCGHMGAWKAGVGDLTKQISILHCIGRAAGLVYAHTPLTSDAELPRPHRGCVSVSDINMETFLNLGHG